MADDDQNQNVRVSPPWRPTPSQSPPIWNLRLDVGAELAGRVADDVDAELGQRLAHLRIVHGGDRIIIGRLVGRRR